MQQELLLKDLCTRFPYGVIVRADEINIAGKLIDINIPYNIVSIRIDVQSGEYTPVPISDVKPYLWPMSSMTEEEIDYVERHFHYTGYNDWDYVDWLNKHYFDYRGLIEKGLSLEAPKGMYKTE